MWIGSVDIIEELREHLRQQNLTAIEVHALKIIAIEKASTGFRWRSDCVDSLSGIEFAEIVTDANGGLKATGDCRPILDQRTDYGGLVIRYNFLVKFFEVNMLPFRYILQCIFPTRSV